MHKCNEIKYYTLIVLKTLKVLFFVLIINTFLKLFLKQKEQTKISSLLSKNKLYKFI